MKIIVTSIFVEDQNRALEFYSETLGFVKKHDEAAGEFRWITLVSPEDQEGTELLLEPNHYPVAKEYQKKIFAEGIPATMFGVLDVHKEYERFGTRREVYDGADRYGGSHSGCLRRYMWQPYPDSAE